MNKQLVIPMLALLVLLTSSPVMAAAKAAPTSAVNINTATAVELMQLPGIGKSKADAIISFREQHPFKAVDELNEVKGIGPKMMEKLAPYISVNGTSPTP